jgi:hypothetical protein
MQMAMKGSVLATIYKALPAESIPGASAIACDVTGPAPEGLDPVARSAHFIADSANAPAPPADGQTPPAQEKI